MHSTVLVCKVHQRPLTPPHARLSFQQCTGISTDFSKKALNRQKRPKCTKTCCKIKSYSLNNNLKIALTFTNALAYGTVCKQPSCCGLCASIQFEFGYIVHIRFRWLVAAKIYPRPFSRSIELVME